MPRGGTPRWLVAALVLVGLVYGRAVGFGFVHDDRVLLEGSARLADLSSLPIALTRDLFWLGGGDVRPSPYWRPVVTASYYLDALVGGGAPWAFHLTNLGLLALLAALVARRCDDVRAGALALCVVALHPMQVEVACNITARTDLLAALLTVLAVTAAGPAGAAWTLLALGSKEVAVVIPLLAWFRGRAAGAGREAWLPHLGAALAWVVARTAIVATLGLGVADRGWPTVESVAGAGARVVGLLGRLIWPVDLVAGVAPPAAGVVAIVFGWAALLALALVLFLPRPSPEGAWERWRFAGRHLAPWVVLPLIPVSGLLAAPVRYAEGFLCLSVVGLAWAVAHHPVFRVFGWLVLAWWGALSAARVPDWRSDRTLFEAAVASHPGDPRAALKLARVVLDEAPDRALLLASGGLTTEQDPRRLRELHAVAAQASLSLQRSDAALQHLRIAAEPGDREATWALAARCVLETGRVVEGGASAEVPSLQSVCAEALRRRPDDAGLWNAAGGEAATRGDRAAAAAAFRRAVELAPDDESYRANLRWAGELPSLQR